MPDFKNSETAKNLMRAVAGESQARNRYTFAASMAKKEGLPVIEAVFQFTANQEKEHAKMWFKEFHGIGDTAENLKDAAEGENYEWTDMYKRMAKEEREEGVEERAEKFGGVARVGAARGGR